MAIRELSPQLARRAQEEIFEKKSEIDGHIKALRQWILKQSHLKARTDDQFLISFLRGTKYNQALARQKIDLFFTMRSEITKARDFRTMKLAKLLKLGTTIPLPDSTAGEDGPRIFLIRPGHYNPKEFDIVDIFKIYVLFTDFLLTEGRTNCTAEHFAQFKPDFVKKMTHLCQDSSPIRPKGFHYVNTPDGFEFVFNMFKSFMSNEYKELLFVHGYDLESLYRYIPKRYLPTEYGGDAGSIASIIDYWCKRLLDNYESLAQWDEYGTNELFRPGAPITEETIMALPDASSFF
ncbi:alpha-tocopherol transfer protein-like isoform X2 [Sitodiplosis mosellana]|uniref:alpha-tocopherol transfer protein-like isoform X2 n=1 Tax=Sitodiplosis mosellana TaxID=263140 RepID=UPI0024448CC3|nr:alpha-tocopherol transfer protein-like isoform X2 [Sitodiplosis mosellana]